MHELLAPCAFVGEQRRSHEDSRICSPFCGFLVSIRNAWMWRSWTISFSGFNLRCAFLGPEYRVYQYILKRDSPELPARSISTASRSAGRSGWGTGRKVSTRSSCILVVLRMRTFQDTRFASHSFVVLSETDHAGIAEGASRESELLTTAVNSLAVQLRGYRSASCRWPCRNHGLPSTAGELHAVEIGVKSASSEFPRGPANCAGGCECWPRHLKQDDQLHQSSLSFGAARSDVFASLARCACGPLWLRDLFGMATAG